MTSKVLQVHKFTLEWTIRSRASWLEDHGTDVYLYWLDCKVVSESLSGVQFMLTFGDFAAGKIVPNPYL